jgi:hypothetical protein
MNRPHARHAPTHPAPAGFSADWLQQRAPFDAAARSAADARLRIRQRLVQACPTAGAPLRLIDLACGTGANLRWLAPQLGGRQQWLAIDHDAALLRCWPEGPGTPGRSGYPLLQHTGPGFEARIARCQLDLAESLESLPWHAAHLVTASALLDLVSAAWLKRLVTAATTARVALLMALSVDGCHRWAPGDAGDATVAALFRAHQRRDKGFEGPALGASAVGELVSALRLVGYQVHTARSDWQLDGRQDARALSLQRALIDGMAEAATEQQPAVAVAVETWRQRRQAIAARSSLRVGHLDLLALPPR